MSHPVWLHILQGTRSLASRGFTTGSLTARICWKGAAGVSPLQSKLGGDGISRQEGFPGCPLDQLHIQGAQRMQTTSAMTLHIREESFRLAVLQMNAQHLGSVQRSCSSSGTSERCSQTLVRMLVFWKNILATIWKGTTVKCRSWGFTFTGRKIQVSAPS